jgi:RNA polymerase sigma-70 factor (ECF subfamily)
MDSPDASHPARPAGDPACADTVAGDAAVLSLAEARLFERAAGGDRGAIGEVWRENRRWIASVLAAHAPRGVDVEDLLQDVASTLVAKCHHIRDAASLRGWLRVVAVNAARMAGRSKSAEKRSLRVLAWRSRPAVEDDARNDARTTLELIARIPPLYAEPLLLQSMQGLSQRQIAEVLDVPETTVETRLARGRRMLRSLLSEAEQTEAGRTGAV